MAQDIIVCKNAKRIDAVIVEVNFNRDEVKYKKQDNPNGPTFILPLSEINTILYAGGEVWTNQGNYVRQDSELVANDAATDKKVLKLQFNPMPTGDKHIFGLTVGYTTKTMEHSKYGSEDISLTESWLPYGWKNKTPGFMVGFTATPEFMYGIGIQTGITYELYRTTYKRSIKEMSVNYFDSYIEQTFNIPLRFQYRYEIIRDLSVLLYTGPVFEVALSPYRKRTEDEVTTKGKWNKYGDDNPKRRFQMYWGCGGGVQWKHLQLRMGGDWGVTELRKKQYHDENVFDTRHKPFHIVMSYLF